MALFGFGSKAAKISQLSSQLQQLQEQLNSQINLNRTIAVYPDYSKTDNADRFCTTDDLYSIIRLIAGTAATIPIYTYIKTGDDEIEAKENDPFRMLVEHPFEGMSAAESVYVYAVSMLTQGECIVWKEIPELGPNKGKPVRLHFMQAQAVNIKVSDTWPRRIVAYQYAPNGMIIMDNIPAAEVIHWKYWNPKLYYNGNELRGLSPLSALNKRLTRSDSNMNTSTAQMQNGIVQTIVFEKNPGATLETASKRRENYYKYASNYQNAGGAYFAADELGAIQLGLKAADMQLADLAKIDFKKLCNAYNISDRLLNNDAAGSEVSDKGARIGLFTNAIQPLLRTYTDGLEMGLASHFKPVKYCVHADYSDVSELQVNYGELVTWLEKAWWISPNEKREMMTFESSPDPMFDKFILPSGLQTLDDLAMLPPIDLNDGQTG